MSFLLNPYSFNQIVTDGLILNLDASSTDSYSGSGTIWYDISGNSRNTTLTNGPVFNQNYFNFDGTNDYLSGVSLPNPNGQMTAEFVIRYNAKNAYQNLYDRGSSSPMLWIDASNRFEVNTTSGIVSSLSYSGQDIVVCVTHNSSSAPGLQLFVNGSLINTNNTIQAAWGNPASLTLLNRAAAQTFSGRVYSIKFYNKILSQAEVTQNYNWARSRFSI